MTKRFSMIFSQVLSVLMAYKVRTVTAVIGVLLGAMALVLVQNVSVALKKKVEEDIKSFGDRVFTVYARVPYTPGQMGRRERIKSMKPADVEAVTAVMNVERAAPVVSSSFSVKYLNEKTTATVIGSTSDYFGMKSLTLADGRGFDPVESRSADKIAVLGKDVYDELIKSGSALGATIYINGVPYEVIGLLEEKGSDPRGNNLDNIIIIPVNSALTRLLGQDYINSLVIQIVSWKDYPMAASDTERVLRLQHGLTEGRPNDFDIINPIDEQELSDTLVNLASLLGSASAGVAFLIGGIGIFSLMLLIVNQRITEIGIKRAIGATKKDILLQFVMESGYIGLLGGASGIIIGCILTVLISFAAGLPLSVSLFGIFVGFTASMLSGMLAGLYPAVKASRIMPVEALRL